MTQLPLNQKLRSLREKCGLTQEQIAKVLNVDRSTYTYYEIGKTEPSLTSLLKLAKLYKVDWNELLGGNSSTMVVAHDPVGFKKAPAAKLGENSRHIYDLDRQEQMLLLYFRSLNADDQQQVFHSLAAMNGETAEPGESKPDKPKKEQE